MIYRTKLFNLYTSYCIQDKQVYYVTTNSLHGLEWKLHRQDKDLALRWRHTIDPSEEFLVRNVFDQVRLVGKFC